MKLWYNLLNFTFVNKKKNATRIIRSNVSSDLKLASCPNRTILSFSVIDTAFTPLSFMAVVVVVCVPGVECKDSMIVMGAEDSTVGVVVVWSP